MSDSIKHECGIALIRLLKPLDFYLDKYGTALYGLNKLCLLMEKQHNRGQDGAGVVTIKLNCEPGERYISRKRSISKQPVIDIFEGIYKNFAEVEEQQPHLLKNTEWLKQNLPYVGELLLGHLRYGTHGPNNIEACHPFLRENNWMTRNLVLAGNFNLTNVDCLFDQLVDIGQHPKEKSDTITVLEKIGHFLDAENQRLFDHYKKILPSHRQISQAIADNLDLQRLLTRAAADFDGGYVMAGLIGHGDAFVLRDPIGIRPVFYHRDDEVVVVASERPAIQTAFDVGVEKIYEITPGHALVIKKDGTLTEHLCRQPAQKQSCSFERIYFSRGTDKDIYQERKKLGYLLVPQVLKAIAYNLKDTVFSFIPNTAETAFYGLMEGIDDFLNEMKAEQIIDLRHPININLLERILGVRPRIEKIAVKDAKLPTFIANANMRKELASHVYDVTYGIVRKNIDTLVVLDDSIVRGTTLKHSILINLCRLAPKKIIIVSSVPQIRYPDCYGIDLLKMNDFVAFRAAILLARENDKQPLIDKIYSRCKDSEHLPLKDVKNEVKSLYSAFTTTEVSEKIAAIVRPNHFFPDIEVIYPPIENLHAACSEHNGDWYFSGNYPTPGGARVANRAFISYIEDKDIRAY